MFCSTSVKSHLLRGLAAFILIFAAMYLRTDGVFGIAFTAVALLMAVVLLRGCLICWLVGLFETLAETRKKTSG